MLQLLDLKLWYRGGLFFSFSLASVASRSTGVEDDRLYIETFDGATHHRPVRNRPKLGVSPIDQSRATERAQSSACDGDVPRALSLSG